MGDFTLAKVVGRLLENVQETTSIQSWFVQAREAEGGIEQRPGSRLDSVD